MSTSPTFHIDAPLSPLYQRQLLKAVSEQGAIVEFAHRDDSLDQAIDAGAGAAIATAAFEFVMLVMLLADRRASRDWTTARVEAHVRDEAAKVFGTTELENLRYADLRAFLSGERTNCVVTAEIDDEDYAFVVGREGDIVVISLQR